MFVSNTATNLYNSVSHEGTRPRARAGSHLIVVALSDAKESDAFETAFRQLGWRAVVALTWESNERLVQKLHPDIVLTERLDVIAGMRQIEGQTPIQVVALVDDDDEAVLKGWTSGADWVVTRPVDATDPLGLSAYIA